MTKQTKIKTTQLLRVGCSALLVAMLTGCAVSQGDVDKAYKSIEPLADQATGDMPASLPLVEDVDSAFLGDRTAPLSYEATLPPVFREKLVTFPANMTISSISQLVSSASGYPVHLSPDVFMSRDQIAGGDKGIGAKPGVQGLANPLATSTGMATEPVYRLPCDRCSVGAYLHNVTEDLGLDYKFDGTTISISRFVTKTFVLAAIPGKVTIKSDLTKGTDTTTGSQGGGTASVGNASTGSFSATTKSMRAGEFDFIASITAELNDLKSPEGKVEINPQTRLVFVHDTKENVQRMTEVLQRENGLALRQVAMRVRTIQLVASGNSQAGVSADMVFNRIQNGITKWSITAAAPASLVTATGASIGLSILKPNAPLTGSSSALQALNTLGKTIEDDSVMKYTLDGVPVAVASYETKGYLAATTPSYGSIAGSSAGVPGLTPGSVTVGKFINLLPSVEDNNRIILSYWNDSSQQNGPFTTISTGSGATQQSIQLTDVIGNKDDQNVSLADGQSMVLYGEVDNHYDSSTNAGIGGASGNWNKQRTYQIVIVTVSVVPSM